MHISDLKHPDSTLQQKLEYLYNLRTGSKINWDSAAYLRLLQRLGNPHLSLPPVIHVAGTNGKGSVVAMLRSIFEAAGYHVHAYTSPHLVRVNERILLAGETISDSVLNLIIDDVLELVGDDKLSFFEIMTAIAFKMFSETPADILLLEVGMGGRLDCTNVIDAPLVSIINRISMDHTEFLGGTLSEIAAQKAGIIKKGVPCVIGYQGLEVQANIVYDILINYAEGINAPVFCFGIDWKVFKKQDSFSFDLLSEKVLFPTPSLLGDHQIYNAGLVLAALEKIKNSFEISEQHIVQGLTTVSWAGRLQHLADVKSPHEIWLDCGHNDSAGEVLAQQVKQWRLQDNKPLILIVGMLGTKDLESFISPLLPFCSQIYCVGISGEPNSQQGEIIAQKIHALNSMPELHVCVDVQAALKKLTNQPKCICRVLIAGSVYLAGEVLSHYCFTSK